MRKIVCLLLVVTMTAAILGGCVPNLPKQVSLENKSSGTVSDNSKLLLISGLENTALQKSYDSVFDKKTTYSFTAELSDGRLWLPYNISDDTIYGATAPVNGNCAKIVTQDIKTKKQLKYVLYKRAMTPNLSVLTMNISHGLSMFRITSQKVREWFYIIEIRNQPKFLMTQSARKPEI